MNSKKITLTENRIRQRKRILEKTKGGGKIMEKR